MWLLCGLDDENYVYPSYQWFDNLWKAKQAAIGSLPKIFEGAYFGKFNQNLNRIDIEFSELSYLSNNPDHFYVYEIFEVNKPYVLVYHHAYNGVDFTVKEFNTREEAILKMMKDYGWTQNPYYIENNEIDIVSGRAIVDDENEWHVWNILRNGEK